MRTTTLALATSLILSLTAIASAQAPAGGSSATGDTNHPRGVTNNGGSADARTIGSAPGGSENVGGRSSDHNGTANTLGKNSLGKDSLDKNSPDKNTGAATGNSGSAQAPRP